MSFHNLSTLRASIAMLDHPFLLKNRGITDFDIGSLV
jgi:hypothetical protein